MDTLYIILIVVVATLGTVYSIKHFKLERKLTDDIDIGTDKVIEIVESFLAIVKLNENVERTIKNVLDIADEVTDFVSEYVKNEADKTTISLAVIDQILVKLGVKLTENEQKLIKIVVNESLDWINKQSK